MKKITHDIGGIMRGYAEKFREDYATTVRALGLEWFKGVIMRTPVKEGRMRGNWLTSVGTPNYAVVDRLDKSGDAAKAEAESNFDPFGVTYMTNNLPYAERREAEGVGR